MCLLLQRLCVYFVEIFNENNCTLVSASRAPGPLQLSIVGFIALFIGIYSGKSSVFIWRNWVVGWDRVQHFVVILSHPHPQPCLYSQYTESQWTMVSGLHTQQSCKTNSRNISESEIRSLMRRWWFPTCILLLPLLITIFTWGNNRHLTFT